MLRIACGAGKELCRDAILSELGAAFCGQAYTGDWKRARRMVSVNPAGSIGFALIHVNKSFGRASCADSSAS